MNKAWIVIILITAGSLLLLLKTHERRTLVPYFKAERSLKLGHFQEAKSRVPLKELPLIELWESMLTGRVAPLDKWMRREYKTLALAHVFTPSGFHLSAVLWPILLLFRKRKHKVALLSFIGAALLFLPGQSALKRMTMVKLFQEFMGLKGGFLLALAIDILFGSFSGSPLGFTYSFLFLGIIYSGAKGITVFVWFFLAQLLIAFVQGSHISPLLLIISPFINSTLALFLPLLFFFAFPLWDWQLGAGIFILRILQFLVSKAYSIVISFPVLEMNVVLLLLFSLLLMRRGKWALITAFVVTTDLNTDTRKIPMSGSYEWQADGRVIKTKDLKIYRTDGICKRELVRGMWFETCSPGRRSRKKGIS